MLRSCSISGFSLGRFAGTSLPPVLSPPRQARRQHEHVSIDTFAAVRSSPKLRVVAVDHVTIERRET
jgi:hypothetical protein